MYSNSLFLNYAAYKWAENYVIKEHLIELNSKELFSEIVKGKNCVDVETFFFTDPSNSHSLPIMMHRMLHSGKIKIVAYYCTKQSFNDMKKELPELCAILQMNGRIVYSHYLALDKAKLPTITV